MMTVTPHLKTNAELHAMATIAKPISTPGRRLSRPLFLVVGAFSFLLLAGCANSRVIVAYHLTIEAESRLSDSDQWSVAPGRIDTGTPLGWEANKFPFQTYREDAIDFAPSAGQTGIVLLAKNKSSEELCLRVDEARIASNFAPAPIPLRATGPFWPVHSFYDLTREQLADIKKQGLQEPPRMCLSPGKELLAVFHVDVKTFFPSGYMFNVTWPEGTPDLTAKGVGNWYTIELPIERAGKRLYYRFKATARDAKARPLKT